MLQVRGRAQGIDLFIRELLGEQLPEPAAESLARQAAFRAFPLGASKFQRVGSRASEALDLEENMARRLLRDTQNAAHQDRKSTRLNSSHGYISYAVFCLKKKNT